MGHLIYSIISGIKYNLLLTIVPSILFLIINQIHIYKGLNAVERVKGLLLNFLVSYTAYQSSVTIVYDIIILAFREFVEVSIALENVLFFLIMVTLSTLFSLLYVKEIEVRNKIEGVVPIQRYFGYFVYAQYIVIIYITLIFADSPIGAWVYMTILYAIWYAIFIKDFDNMTLIYSSNRGSVENICLFFQVVLIIIIYAIPQALVNAGIDIIGKSYFQWLKALSIIEFVYCTLVHKVIYLQTLHRSNEMKNLCTDDLTGLSSRGYLLSEGEKVLSAYEDNTLAIVFLNIFRFKYINQNYGNAIGDTFLKCFAEQLRDNFDDAIVISRISDDKFGIITANTHNIELNLLKCRNGLVRQNIIKDDSFNIVLKAGVYSLLDKKIELEEALSYATSACENAPATNTVSVQFFDEDILKEEKLQEYVLDNLERAMQVGLIKVYYQPIVDVKTEKYVSAEALVRWFDDKHGFIPPGKFIDNLENQNLIYKIDCFVVEQVCKTHRRLLDEGKTALPVSFNISKKDFFSIDMVDYVEKMVAKYDIPRSLLKIEITESVISSEDEFVKEQIQRFVDHGYKIWMDDFGSGYSSLNILGSYHFDGIKLDQVFLRNLTDQKAELLRGIVHTAKLLGIEVLAEGVENSAQHHLLEDIGCEMAQGFKFCMPMSIEEHLQTSEKYVQKD